MMGKLRRSLICLCVGLFVCAALPLDLYGVESHAAAADNSIQTQAVNVNKATANPVAGEQVKWQVISGGGVGSSSTNYRMNATVGQNATGLGTSTSYKVNAGFWQNFVSSCCLKAGDANNDTKVNVGDAVFVINYVFKAGTAPSCKEQADANADSKVNVGDAVYLINYVFKAGPVPKCP
jgi:hypothetical protein